MTSGRGRAHWAIVAHDPDEAAVAVPDVPGVVLAWRAWRVSRPHRRTPVLMAPLRDSLWPPGVPTEARCGARHAAPADDCECGLYGVADPAAVVWGTSGRTVLGAVSLWGEVLGGDRGWRASRAYPRFLITDLGITPADRHALAAAYRVPVVASTLPLRELAPVIEPALCHAPPDDLGAALTERMDTWRVRAAQRREHRAAAPTSRARRWWRRAA